MRWDSFIYYFLVGGTIFFASLILAWRSGDLSWKRKEDKRCTLYLLLGVFVYFTFYLLWQLYAIGII